jgi:hypothetical protein
MELPAQRLVKLPSSSSSVSQVCEASARGSQDLSLSLLLVAAASSAAAPKSGCGDYMSANTMTQCCEQVSVSDITVLA